MLTRPPQTQTPRCGDGAVYGDTVPLIDGASTISPRRASIAL